MLLSNTFYVQASRTAGFDGIVESEYLSWDMQKELFCSLNSQLDKTYVLQVRSTQPDGTTYGFDC